MNPYDFRRLRKRLFPSQKKAAEALGVKQSAVSQWETGARAVPELVVRHLKLLEQRAKCPTCSAAAK